MADIFGDAESPDYLENPNNPNEDDYIDGLGGGLGGRIQHFFWENNDVAWWENKDVARGHGGDDILVGNLGSYDVLMGGLGTDTFNLNTSNNIELYLDGLNGSHPFVLDVVNQNIHWLPDYDGGEDGFGSENSVGSGDNISLPNATPSTPINAIVFDSNGNPIAIEEITLSTPFFFNNDGFVYNPALTLVEAGYFDIAPYFDLLNIGDFNTNPIVEMINQNFMANYPGIF